MSKLVRAVSIIPQSFSYNCKALSRRTVNIQPLFSQQWRFAGGKRNSDDAMDEDHDFENEEQTGDRRRNNRREEGNDEWRADRGERAPRNNWGDRPPRDNWGERSPRGERQPRGDWGEGSRGRFTERRRNFEPKTGEIDKKSVMIRNFPFDSDAEEVESIVRSVVNETFPEEEAQKIRVFVPRLETGKAKSFAFVNCQDEDSAAAILEAFQGKEALGRQLQSLYAFQRPPRNPTY